MNKTDFIKAVAERKDINPRKAYYEVNDVMDTLRVILSRGEDVQLGDPSRAGRFGTFEILTDLRGERIPMFKGGKALKKVLNTIKEE